VDDPGFESRQEKEISLSSKSTPALGTTQPAIQWGHGTSTSTSSAGIKK